MKHNMQADTKTALLDLAERAVRSRGYDGFSYADLARAQGIRKASIHYHFPTKADLSQNLMARYHTRFEKQLLRITTGRRTGSMRWLSSTVTL